MKMTEELRNDILDLYDRRPASVAVQRKNSREIIARLGGYSELEKEILDWDEAGRPSAEFESIRLRAWNFKETGNAALRHRLFAGFVTSAGDMDGYGADFLIDIALHLGIAPDVIHDIMIRNNSKEIR